MQPWFHPDLTYPSKQHIEEEAAARGMRASHAQAGAPAVGVPQVLGWKRLNTVLGGGSRPDVQTTAAPADACTLFATSALNLKIS
jgi:hypothetical protein